MSGYPISTSRDVDTKVYRRGQLLNHTTHLCMVAERLSSWRAGANMFHGLPWITPIVGTGCLDLGNNPEIDRQVLRKLLDGWLDRHDVKVPLAFGQASREAFDFANHLKRDRCAGSDQSGEPSEALTLSETTAALLLLSALATSLYLEGRARMRQPSSRWSTNDVALLDSSGGPEIMEMVDAAMGVSRALRSTLGSTDTSSGAAILQLLSALESQLREGSLPLDHVRMLTEVTWLAMVDGSSIYPGWSDVLVELVLRFATEAPRGRHPQVRDLTILAESVGDLLEDTTRRSWAQRTQGGGAAVSSRRARLYDSVAGLLDAQARVFAALSPVAPAERAGGFDSFGIEDDLDYADDGILAPAEALPLVASGDPGNAVAQAVLDDSRAVLAALGGDSASLDLPAPPHPVALVTSFDIELEMALWAAGRPFRVVLPVLVASRMSMTAELVWLSADIDPTSGSDLDDLLVGPHTWHVATRVISGREGGDRPVVVRLSGTPLFSLPDPSESPLDAELADLGLLNPRGLHHALTVDEYTSQRQSETEWFYAGQVSRSWASGGNEPRSHRPDLPDCLAVGAPAHDRIWLALGVQLDDHTIRGRLFAQITAASVKHHPLEAQERGPADQEGGTGTEGDRAVPKWSNPEIHGIAVNRRMDRRDEAALLHWLSFDIALDLDCGDLAPELEHCTDHLVKVLRTLEDGQVLHQTPGDLEWHRPGTSCPSWGREKRTSK